MNDEQTVHDALSTGMSRGRMMNACPCAQCGTANSPDRKFCANCGTPLWEPCLHCGVINGAWEKFCGICGGNLLEALQSQIAQVQSQEVKARSFQSLCRHPEAIQLLRTIAVSPHPRLAPHVVRAHDFAQALKTDLERLEQEREASYQRAQTAMASQDYEQTIQCLDLVHRRLRSSEMQRLLEQAREAQEEAARLAAEIREAVAAKNVAGLLAKVLRLQELKPDHAEAQNLAERLQQMELRTFEGHREQLITAAQEKLAAQAYDEAVRLFEQINESVRTPEINKLLALARDRAAEVAWLVQDLREVAVFDDLIPGLGERLLKLKPKDEQVARFVEKVRQQHQERKEKHRPGQETMLVRGKRETPFGFPVDPLVGFRRIDTSKFDDTSVFAENPGGFYVSCGLALQGLEKASVNVNLMPAGKQNVFSKLASGLLKKRFKGVWGIDVGVCSIKALRLVLEAENKEDKKAEKNLVVADACELIEYAQPLSYPDVEQEKTVREALQKFLEKHKIEEDLICVSFPGQKTLARFIKLPPTDKKKITELIKFEARQLIPFDLETVTWGYQITSSGPEISEGIREYDVGVLAVRTHEVDQFLFPFGELQIKIDVLQAASVALHNYLHFDRYSTEPDSPDAARQEAGEPNDADQETSCATFATLDLGADSSNLIISNRDSVWLRSLPVGSHHLNRALVSELKLTRAQAEQVKRNPLKWPLTSKVYQTLRPPLRELVGELTRSLSYFENTYCRRPVKQLYLVGNGAKLHGLIRILRAPLPGMSGSVE